MIMINDIPMYIFLEIKFVRNIEECFLSEK